MFKQIYKYSSGNVIIEDEDTGYDEVTLKWDGCVDFRTGLNGLKPSEDKTGENSQYIHICDIDEMIEKLNAIKKYGNKHFDNQYWR